MASNNFSPDDVLVLPEHFTFDHNPVSYTAFVSGLARKAGCTIVGGSHHRPEGGKHVNTGVIVDRTGEEVGRYTKMRPYFHEQGGVIPGKDLGEFIIHGRRFLVLVCADFWYSDILLRAAYQPDVVVIPALSVSRKPSPSYSRMLWRHLAITRAYEFGVYVGISDWSEGSVLPRFRASGVGGLADPTTTDPDALFRPIASEGIAKYPLDFDALEAFRQDRRMRGFFWK